MPRTYGTVETTDLDCIIIISNNTESASDNQANDNVKAQIDSIPELSVKSIDVKMF